MMYRDEVDGVLGADLKKMAVLLSVIDSARLSCLVMS